MDSLVSEGMTLMALGMGTVFVFLTLLVLITTLMSACVKRWAPESESTSATPAVQSGSAVDPQLLKVLSKAVAAYKKRQ